MCLVFPKSHSISSMFRGTLLDALFISLFCTSFTTLAPSSMTTLSLLYHFNEFARRVGLWPIEQSPLTDCEPKTPLRSAAITRRSICLREKSILDSDLNDFTTTVDVFEMIEPTDVGHLTSALFSGARSKCLPTQCSWLSDTITRGETPAQIRFSEAQSYKII